MQVQFFFEHRSISLTERGRLKKFIPTIFRKESKVLLHLNYIFCSDTYLLKINKEYLNHNYYTDIITFSLSEPGTPISGDIYISTDRVRDNACKEATTIKEELHRVIFHGALHLCGYMDKTKDEKLLMQLKEDQYLQMYFS